MKKRFLNVAERKREVDWQIRDWGFQEVVTELGLGLIDQSGRYHPTTDLIALAMRICRIIEGDDHYLSTSIQLAQAGRRMFTPVGGAWMIANPNPDAHPEMNNQMLHMRLLELTSVEQAARFAEQYKIRSNEAGMFVTHDRLVFTLTARSWVSGVANVETHDRFPLVHVARPAGGVFPTPGSRPAIEQPELHGRRTVNGRAMSDPIENASTTRTNAQKLHPTYSPGGSDQPQPARSPQHRAARRLSQHNACERPRESVKLDDRTPWRFSEMLGKCRELCKSKAV